MYIYFTDHGLTGYHRPEMMTDGNASGHATMPAAAAAATCARDHAAQASASGWVHTETSGVWRPSSLAHILSVHPLCSGHRRRLSDIKTSRLFYPLLGIYTKHIIVDSPQSKALLQSGSCMLIMRPKLLDAHTYFIVSGPPCAATACTVRLFVHSRLWLFNRLYAHLICSTWRRACRSWLGLE